MEHDAGTRPVERSALTVRREDYGPRGAADGESHSRATTTALYQSGPSGRYRLQDRTGRKITVQGRNPRLHRRLPPQRTCGPSPSSLPVSFTVGSGALGAVGPLDGDDPQETVTATTVWRQTNARIVVAITRALPTGEPGERTTDVRACHN